MADSAICTKLCLLRKRHIAVIPTINRPYHFSKMPKLLARAPYPTPYFRLQSQMNGDMLPTFRSAIGKF